MSFADWAERGFGDELVPVEAGGKKPAIAGWQTHVVTAGDIEAWDRAGFNVGLRTRYFPCVDIDVDDDQAAADVAADVIGRLGDAPARSRGTSRRALLYRLEGPSFKKLVLQLPDDTGKVELLGDGQQVVVEGRHPSGRTYSWTTLPVADDLPSISADGRALLNTRRSSTIPAVTIRPASTFPPEPWSRVEALAREALSNLDPDMEHDDWLKVGMALHAKDPDRGFDLWDGWSSNGTKYPGTEEMRRRWASFKADGGLTFGTLLNMAGVSGRGATEAAPAPPPEPAPFDYAALLELVRTLHDPATDGPALLEDPKVVASLRALPPARLDGFAKALRRAAHIRRQSIDAALATSAPAVDGETVPGHSDDDTQQRAQSAQLVALVEDEGVQFFHDRDEEAYARAPTGETWVVGSSSFRRWLAGRLYRTGTVPREASLKDALVVMGYRAVHDGPELPVFVRVGRLHEAIYLDLGEPTWRAVEITAAGWRILPAADVPVRFHRPRGLLALPDPAPGGKLAELRPHLNVPDDEGWALVASFLVASVALAPSGPFPILAIRGEQGSAKSTASANCAALIDPRTSGLRAPPKNLEDLAVAAHNGYLIGLENVSHIEHWLSDALCRLATGGGFATRKHYENKEEATFEATRPVLLNGIEHAATRGDLLDRTVVVELPRIEESRRLTAREASRRFLEARPRILAGLYDAVALALRERGSVVMPSKPRMADYAEVAVAAEPACGVPPGTFLRAYGAAQDEGAHTAAGSDPVASAIQAFMFAQPVWEGTAGELLMAITRGDARPGRYWPTGATSMGNRLQRLAPSLRKLGIEVEQYRHANARGWRLSKSQGDTPPSSPTGEDPSTSDAMTVVTPFPGESLSSRRRKVTARLRAGPAIVADLAEALRRSVPEVEADLRQLADDGTVERVAVGSPPVWKWRMKKGAAR